MSKPNKIIILTIIFLLGIASIYFVVSQNLQITQPTIQFKEGNWIEIDLKGYNLSCRNPGVSKKQSGRWERIQNSGLGGYLLDGKEGYNPGCDVLGVCKKRQWPLSVNLVEYNKIGERELSSGRIITEYISVPLTGEVLIEYSYFIDPWCIISKDYSVVLKR